MPTPRTTCALIVGTLWLAHITGCASEPAPSTAHRLPEVPVRDQGIGLDDDIAEESSRQNPVALPDAPGSRDLATYLDHANRNRVAINAPVFDLDAAAHAMMPIEPGERTGETTSANASAVVTDPQIAPHHTTKTSLDTLVGAPANDIFATIESEPELDAASGDETNVLDDLDALLRRLERLTGDEALASAMPLGPALRAGALETHNAGALERALGTLGPDAPFTPDERALLLAWTRLHRQIGEGTADPIEVAQALRDAAEETAALLPMRIATVNLCKTVNGYGSYDPLYRRGDAITFVAGRAHKAIVYAEIERFESRERTRGTIDGFEVDLKQTVELIHLDKGDGAADLVAWSEPEQRITDFSRKRRRDFYTLQIIELPGTLSIGRYHLRLTVKDATSGEQAQAIVPVDVVALPNLDSADADP